MYLTCLNGLATGLPTFCEPHELVVAGILLHTANGYCHDSLFRIRILSFCRNVYHHARKQFSTWVGQREAYVVGMCQRIALHTAHKLCAVEGLATKCLGGNRHTLVFALLRVEESDLLFGDRYFYLHLGDVQDRADRL